MTSQTKDYISDDFDESIRLLVHREMPDKDDIRRLTVMSALRKWMRLRPNSASEEILSG